MGWAARATKELQVNRYHVRRFTAFNWPADASPEARRDREAHLIVMAKLIERRLREVAYAASVEQCDVNGAPQLMFEMVVKGTDDEDALRRAVNRCERALQTRVPQGNGRKIRLTPPWGVAEVERI